MLYFRISIVIVKDGISLLPNAIKDTPYGAREVDLKGSSGEGIRAFGIGITFEVVVILNATPEISNAVSESVIPSDIRLDADSFAYLDGVTVYEVIVENWGGTVT